MIKTLILLYDIFMSNRKEKIKKLHTKKFYIRIICLIVFLSTLFTFFLSTWFIGDDSTIKYINSLSYSYEQNENIEISKFPEKNYVQINNKTGRSLKFLQLTDIHLGCGYLTINLDKKVINEIFKCVDAVNPDIIIVSGDALSAIYVTSGTRNSYLQLDALILLMEKLGRPYTFCFGNHDGEGLASKEYIAKKLEESENSFFLRGDENLTGEGNYFVKLYNNGILNSSIILMDSGARNGLAYAGVDKKQVKWYEQTINELKAEKSDIKNLLFMHIPIPEYLTFYKKWLSGNDNYVLLHGEKHESISHGIQSGLYDKMKELDSTKWVFCGHDHINNFAITEKSTGITLSYSMSMDYSTYPLLRFQTKHRGANLIEIDDLGNVKISLVNQNKGYVV